MNVRALSSYFSKVRAFSYSPSAFHSAKAGGVTIPVTDGHSQTVNV